MNSTLRNRLAIALLGSAVALSALPLAQALAEPAPPAAPAAPVEKRVVIIRHEGGEVADVSSEAPGAQTRVITREGKTIVIRSTAPLSDEEIERHIASAEAGIPQPPEPPTPPVPGQRTEKRIVIREGAGAGREDIDVEGSCAANEVANVDSTGDKDGKHTRMRIRICSNEGETPVQALAAVRRARADVAANGDIPDSVKSDVLGQLDREIARLEKNAS